MNEKLLLELRNRPNLKNAIIEFLTVDEKARSVKVEVITDTTFDDGDSNYANKVVQKYVPSFFKTYVELHKLSPDNAIIEKSIFEIINRFFKSLSALITIDDIKAQKENFGFGFTIKAPDLPSSAGMIDFICAELKRRYCGEFKGKFINSEVSVEKIETCEDEENIEYEIPIRKFKISGFKKIESEEKREYAVYLADLNFKSDNVVVCGEINKIDQKQYTNAKGQACSYYKITINDTTARLNITYFVRHRTAEKIEKLKVGDSIVCTGKTEQYNGYMSFLANHIDFGSVPKGFVPEKRQSKPVPKNYITVKPKEYKEFTQSDLFKTDGIPECLSGKSFVVFDIETTGLNSIAQSGNIDEIIEIGAYKIIDGAIKEYFSTYVKPQRKLSEEIKNLTGITDEMLVDAPTYKQVMPDFYKFCFGSVLVGHNITGFDFKFVDYYCARLGYMLERKLIDTIPLSQELLSLSNYKLNTIANKFDIVFNHHRALDDAFVTAKIFLELIKLKKSLPNWQ